MSLKIVHYPDECSFRSPEGALLSYRVEGGRYVFDHTFVPPELRGGGVAGQLAKAALEHARAEGWTVVPDCSYIEKYIARHPEYRSLLP